MAFLDNSGDIILDAVLTDAGRQRLAKGDGSFKIVKFALGDDEINYELYDKNDTRGSAFYDLEILQSPVFEAFTNNTATMKSKLVTIARNDILYLPVLLLNTKSSSGAFGLSTVTNLEGTIPLSSDAATADALVVATTGPGTGTFYSAETGNSKAVVVDQGLNTGAIPPSNTISADLYEDSYSIQLDNRLLTLRDGSSTGANVDISFIDDDNIALYNVSSPSGMIDDISTEDGTEDSVIAGPRGSRLSLGFKSSTDVMTSTYLFTRLGGEITLGTTPQTYYYIDTNVRITGLTTGYRIDLPLRILKIKNT
tara:strand:- start:336 stop:1265 length:930 start_codon:yes stop_codon:yes gene_type:complete